MAEELTTISDNLSMNLTAEDIQRAIDLLPDRGLNLVGVKVNPADLEYMGELVGVSAPTNAIFVTPLYSVKVIPDVSIPRGLAIPVYD